MIDLHSHALPEFDDGSESIEMSLEMLSKSYEQGVRTVVLTPHFHAYQEQEYRQALEKRSICYQRLLAAVKKYQKPLPKLLLGCELALTGEVLAPELLRELCIENTDYMLVEMPYTPWTQQHFNSLDRLSLKYRIILAHIERFWDYQKHFSKLLEYDPIFQVNATSFDGAAPFAVIRCLMQNGMVQVIGTDMHNTDSRPPNLSAGFASLERYFGAACAEDLKRNAEKVLQNQSVELKSFRMKPLVRFFHSK